MLKKQLARLKRKKSIRKKLSGTANLPRLSVNRSNLYISAQIIDDENSKTLFGMDSSKLNLKGTKTEKSKIFGTEFGKKAVAANITSVVFDRSGYKYHGRIKAFADAVREAGINF